MCARTHFGRRLKNKVERKKEESKENDIYKWGEGGGGEEEETATATKAQKCPSQKRRIIDFLIK